jgi:hypothetical protein
LIQWATTIKNKDIRNFSDGIYVSENGTVQQADEYDLSYQATEIRSGIINLIYDILMMQ